jgi:hypothetical protein
MSVSLSRLSAGILRSGLVIRHPVRMMSTELPKLEFVKAEKRGTNNRRFLENSLAKNSPVPSSVFFCRLSQKAPTNLSTVSDQKTFV